MAFPASSLYAATLMAGWNATATNIDIDTNQLKIGLYDLNTTQDPVNSSPQAYTTTGELASAGGYTRGAKNLGGTVTFAINAGIIVCSTSATTDWSSATFSGVKGCIIWDSIATSPVANPCIVAVAFGTDGSSGGGTFTIDWADGAVANTIFTIDPTP